MHPTKSTLPKNPSLFRSNEQSLAEAATQYAERGWPVLPLRPRDKRPATPHGLHDASADPDKIAAYWHTHPDANIGLRTGITFDVLDLDSAEAVTELRTFIDNYAHTGPVSATGKGWHYLFLPTGNRNGAAIRPGVDFRGDGGYIVAPPSIHPSGHVYRWLRDGQLTAAPAWLRELTDPLVRPTYHTREVNEQTAKALALLPPIAEAFSQAFPTHQLSHQRNRYVTTCPFHPDDTPSLVLYPATNSFYCFGCQAWGDPLNLIHYQKTGRLR